MSLQACFDAWEGSDVWRFDRMIKHSVLLNGGVVLLEQLKMEVQRP